MVVVAGGAAAAAAGGDPTTACAPSTHPPPSRPLLAAVAEHGAIESLDLSGNDLDGAASDGLASFLAAPDCPLVKLVLQAADVDDAECARFVGALAGNAGTRLAYADFSRNSIGMASVLRHRRAARRRAAAVRRSDGRMRARPVADVTVAVGAARR